MQKKGQLIETEKDIEIAWPSDAAVRLANAIFHTYKVDEFKDPEREVPMPTVCKMFGIEYNEESVAYIAGLIGEILDEPIAVINKTISHRLIKWQTYDFFTLHEPIGMNSDVIRLKINLDYLRITEEFVANPFLEF